MSSLEHVVGCQSKLGEGPLWHPVEQALYWLDIVQGRLHRFDPADGQHQAVELGVVTGSMGVRAGGGFVMATRKGFGFWDPATGQLEIIHEPDPDDQDTRFNDGKTDRQGHFWAGKMSMSDRPRNSLFRLDPDGSVHRMESGVMVSNGLGWSPDNHTLYFTDSPARLIYAYDFEAFSGTISNRRVFTHVPEGQGSPDGLAIDQEGCIWSARWGGWKVVRYRPDGSIEREVPMPVEFPTSCAFGGPGLDDLYITSAWVAVGPDRRGEQPLAGDVFRLKAPAPGFPEPLFAG